MKNKKISTIVLALIFAAGLALLLYPTVSDVWNKMHQSRAIVQYTRQVETLDPARFADLWAQAEAYNRTLLDNPDRFQDPEAQLAACEQLLVVSDTDVIGTLEIPGIGVTLPIYHGTSEGVLQVGVGNVEGSSLPTGGAGTHCVLSGHRGLPSARLLTDLDDVIVGDTFTLTVLDRTMTYQVDQILTVLPYEMEALAIDPQQDYCTLVTCTPYGINTHRLLVRGRRVDGDAAAQPAADDGAPAAAALTADAVPVPPATVAAWLLAPFAVAAAVVLFVKLRKKN